MTSPEDGARIEALQAQIQTLFKQVPPEQLPHVVGGALQGMDNAVLHGIQVVLTQELENRTAQQATIQHTAAAEPVSPVVSEVGRAPEDEFVRSVKYFNLYGKFPQGLDIEGEEVFSPGVWNKEFTFARSGHFFPSGVRELTGHFFPDDRDNQVTKDHGVLAVYPEVKSPGDSSVIFIFPQLGHLRDGGGRAVRFGDVVFQMPTDQANAFVDLVKQDLHGADIAERFIHKTAPGILATQLDRSGNSKGILRPTLTGLYIYDQADQDAYTYWNKEHNGASRLGNPRSSKYLRENLPDKLYSAPITLGRTG